MSEEKRPVPSLRESLPMIGRKFATLFRESPGFAIFYALYSMLVVTMTILIVLPVITVRRAHRIIRRHRG